MKNNRTYILLLLILLAQINISAQSSAYEIATWKGFTESAISYTWDDNTSGHTEIVIPLFNKYNLKATFFVTTDWVKDWLPFEKASTNGHEIASHTLNHPNFKNLNETQRVLQLSAKDTINKYISDAQCMTFAYPYCDIGTDMQTSKYYIASRTCQGKIEDKTPGNFMQISAISCGSKNKIRKAEDFNTVVDSSLLKNGWVVFVLHGIDDDGGYSPIQSEELEKHLVDLSDRSDDVWVATFVDVVKYIKARNSAEISELYTQERELAFDLRHDLEDIYKVPLSIKRKMPSQWKAARVNQGNDVLTSSIIEEGGGRYLHFDALPNSWPIVIRGRT